jgi:hypothetical protein
MWFWQRNKTESPEQQWPHLRDRVVRKKLQIPADALILTGPTPRGLSVQEQRRRIAGGTWKDVAFLVLFVAFMVGGVVSWVQADSEGFLRSAGNWAIELAVLVVLVLLGVHFGPAQRDWLATTRRVLGAAAAGDSRDEIMAWFDRHWPFYLPPGIFRESYTFVAGERGGRPYLVVSEVDDTSESGSFTRLSRSLLFIAEPAPELQRPVRLRELPVPEHGDVANVVRTPAGLFVFWCTPCLGHDNAGPAIDATLERVLMRLEPEESAPVSP